MQNIRFFKGNVYVAGKQTQKMYTFMHNKWEGEIYK